MCWVPSLQHWQDVLDLVASTFPQATDRKSLGDSESKLGVMKAASLGLSSYLEQSPKGFTAAIKKKLTAMAAKEKPNKH